MGQKKRVIALGFFDGVHLGHGALLRRVTEQAAREGCVPAAVTYDHHPKNVIPGAEHVDLINTPEDRAGLMRRLYGIEEVIILPFDAHMRDMYWRDFVTELLVKEYGAVHLVAGHDNHFGRKGEGDSARLRALCGELGVGCDIIGEVMLDGIVISSTHIRALIQAGNMEGAARFLGHPHVLTGPWSTESSWAAPSAFPRPIWWCRRGCSCPPSACMPPRSGWASGTIWPLPMWACAPRWTTTPHRVTVEPWILDFDGDLYGKEIRVEFYKQLRRERKFGSVEELPGRHSEKRGRDAGIFQMRNPGRRRAPGFHISI